MVFPIECRDLASNGVQVIAGLEIVVAVHATVVRQAHTQPLALVLSVTYRTVGRVREFAAVMGTDRGRRDQEVRQDASVRGPEGFIGPPAVATRAGLVHRL